MNLQEFKKDIIDNYIDQDMQVTINKNPGKWSTGNGLLHSGIFHTILAINNLSDKDDIHRFTGAVIRCWAQDTLGPVYGLLNRNQGRPDKEAQDDYIGVCSGSYFVNPRIAGFIVSYGKDHHFSYDNTSPNHFSFSTWHGRFPGLIGFYQMCSGVTPSWLQRVCLSLKIRNGVSENVSDTILSWLQYQVAKRHEELKKSCASWERLFKEKYGSLGALFASYFGSDHPFSKLTGLNGFD